MIAKKVNKKRVNAFDKKNIFCYHGNGSSSNEILILDMFNPYLSNARPVIAVAYIGLLSVSAVRWICQALILPKQKYSWVRIDGQRPLPGV